MENIKKKHKIKKTNKIKKMFDYIIVSINSQMMLFFDIKSG